MEFNLVYAQGKSYYGKKKFDDEFPFLVINSNLYGESEKLLVEKKWCIL